MGKTIKLASVLLKCGLGNGMADEQKKKIFRKGTVNPVYFLCLLPVMYYLFRGGVLLQDFFGAADEDGVIIGFFLFLVSAIIFCTGIVSCINSFYLSSNLNTILVMPFTATQIAGAKFMVAAVYEYGISIVVLIPVFVGYGYSMGASAAFWIGAVLSVLLLPIVPLAYGAVVSMIVMRFIGGVRNRERLAVLGAVSTFMLTILYEVIRGAAQKMRAGDIEEAVAHLAGIFKNASKIFFDIPFLVRIMEKSDWLSILWCVLSVAGICVIFLLVSKIIYLSGAVGMQNASASHRKLTEKQFKKENRRTGVLWSYTRKELRMLARTPVYYISCLFLTLGWPLIVVLPGIFSGEGADRTAWIINLLTRPDSSVYFVFVLFCMVLGITVFVTSLNGIASTSISREGQSFYIMKQLPLSYRKQLRAKQNTALIICGIGSGGYMVLGELFLVFMRGFPWWGILLTLLFNILILYIIVDLEMIYGIMKPKLVWESEGEVATQSRIGFIFFLLGITVCCIVIFGCDEWVKSLSCAPWIFVSCLCGILAIPAIILNRIFYVCGERVLDRL